MDSSSFKKEIRPTLVIGLGGTGCKAIKSTMECMGRMIENIMKTEAKFHESLYPTIGDEQPEASLEFLQFLKFVAIDTTSIDDPFTNPGRVISLKSVISM